MKVCSRCHIKKDDSQFRQRLDKRDGRKYLNNECYACDRERASVYYVKRKDDPEFKEKNRIRAKEYAEKNVEQIRKIRKSPEYAKKHAALNLKSYYRMRDLISAKMREKRKTDEYKQMMREYRKKNKEKIYQQEVITKKRYSNKHRDGLTDKYISRLLITQGVASYETLSKYPQIIEAKRLQILIKRKIYTHGY